MSVSMNIEEIVRSYVAETADAFAEAMIEQAIGSDRPVVFSFADKALVALICEHLAEYDWVHATCEGKRIRVAVLEA